MKLLSFVKDGIPRVGALVAGGVLDLPLAYSSIHGTEAAPDFLYSMRRLAELGDPAVGVVRELIDRGRSDSDLLLDPSSIKWLPPIPDPEKILCVAVNYKAHGEETKHAPPEKPYFFPKFRNALIGNGDPILKPRVSYRVDWEVELGVVIGRRGKYVDEKEALNHVFGYTVVNDVSMRDWQFPPGWPEKLNAFGQNWIWGKSMDSATPMGPVIATPDEVGDPGNLKLTLKVNGETQQEGNTGGMIFGVPQLIHWASQGLTLRPGDVISTGTPQGVGEAKGKYLKNGDTVEAEVEKVGKLVNPVKDE
ncbi:2-hydroxyhepta-2,4-diene-1,7-dioate isomerase [Thermocladium modestius]|uniref:2-hydroxyhepta-2,4-diene-1,7-dioate isomerase n=1 Tax=Thermocladium modestius TaxID=62609 RepID=A0A830GSY6_9CREN|nr:fumarylacetoacetate hydrolase family protein [Thermocladium modestius]GGP19085.1 2-hydroxyhepta-2,4-diene-1,7-dioate isomerase [Thermocladium modestius]